MGELARNDSDSVPRRDVVGGFIYTHLRLSYNSNTLLETASFLYGMLELLIEKGVISVEELDARKQEVAARLAEKSRQQGISVLLQDGPEIDKYHFTEEVDIDCESRLNLCKAACCRLPFALSKQDVHEGIIHWDLSQPYVIAQDGDGYCTHLDRGNCHCGARDARPVACRAYDCRKDDKIWLDFDRRTINPAILSGDWPRDVPAAQVPSRD